MMRFSSREAFTNGLVLGSSTAWLAIAIGHDIRGLDGTIAVIRESWWPRHITVPLESFLGVLIAVAFWACFRATREHGGRS